MKQHFNPNLIRYFNQLLEALSSKLKNALDYYWQLSPESRYRLRLAAFAFGILVVGFTVGRLTTVNRAIKIEQQEKQIAVDQTGAMSLTLPGVTLNPEIYRFEKATRQAVPQEIKVPGRLVFNAEKGKLLSARVS
ncbi:MAG: hypothetical protein EBX45_06600, partial [Burkholderiaceae bacterium]|nr:hypothetical protein [Burkholderiaceae bacterium]